MRVPGVARISVLGLAASLLAGACGLFVPDDGRSNACQVADELVEGLHAGYRRGESYHYNAIPASAYVEAGDDASEDLAGYDNPATWFEDYLVVLELLATVGEPEVAAVADEFRRELDDARTAGRDSEASSHALTETLADVCGVELGPNTFLYRS
jgi:hypothetical protein